MQEAEIIASVLAGNTADYSILVKKYESSVFRIAMGYVHQQQDAEDITQEVFVKAFRALDRFSGRSSFSSWLYRIAVNSSINAVQKKKRHPLVSFAASLLQLPLSSKNADQLVEEKSAYSIIREAIDSLPEKQRTAFILSKYEELPQRDVAQIMHISEGAVEQLLIRARDNLRKKLKQP